MTAASPVEGITVYGPKDAVPASDMPAGELTARLVEQVRQLVHDEFELARIEGIKRAKRIGLGVGMFGGAGMLAFFGTACLIASAVIGLANVARPWFAAIVVGVVCFVVGGLVALPGKRGFVAKHPPVPRDTAASLKADAQALRDAANRDRTAEPAHRR